MRMRTYLHIIGMYSKRSELETRVRMAVLCTPNQSFEPRKSDMVSEKVPFQVPRYRYQRSEFEIRVEIRVASCTFL